MPIFACFGCIVFYLFLFLAQFPIEFYWKSIICFVSFFFRMIKKTSLNLEIANLSIFLLKYLTEIYKYELSNRPVGQSTINYWSCHTNFKLEEKILSRGIPLNQYHEFLTKVRENQNCGFRKLLQTLQL